MKLEKVLDNLNSLEKNSFLKILDNLLSNNPKAKKEVEKIFSEGSVRDLKGIDSINIKKLFSVIEVDYSEYIKQEFLNITSQIDILIDIIIRDGNCIMRADWLLHLYQLELKKIENNLGVFTKALEGEANDFDELRLRDYRIYYECLNTAYSNDALNNQEKKITTDELAILLKLRSVLELSQEEAKLVNYSIIPIKKLDIDSIINELKGVGIAFYSRKTNTVYVPDEIVKVLRGIRGKVIADKYFRRVLRAIKEPQINLICRKHGVDWRMSFEDKIEVIINSGISLFDILFNDIHKEPLKLNDKKKWISEFADLHLKISGNLRGSTVEEKFQSFTDHFNDLEKDERIGISHEGYERMLLDLDSTMPNLNDRVRTTFQLQDEKVLTSVFLLDFNIKPRDVLELIDNTELLSFAKSLGLKGKSDTIDFIIDKYKDTENLFLESFELLGNRDFNGLKENGIVIKEAEIGAKFEEITKLIFEKLGLKVNEEVRKRMNTNKDQVDIVVSLSENELILIECKTAKDSGYNKFSAVSRQLKAYDSLAKKNGFTVAKSLLVAPDFSDDFIKECGLEYELNLSLIKASTLYNILVAFKSSKLKIFPYNLLMRDVLIQEDRVIKAISK
ncbi:MAG: hypothetical protein Q8J69_06850 [Sphingobacteriaceae bacterium]|nr:hypothetical protein [Sphingobacteriaceae bacterium]